MTKYMTIPMIDAYLEENRDAINELRDDIEVQRVINRVYAELNQIIESRLPRTHENARSEVKAIFLNRYFKNWIAKARW